VGRLTTALQGAIGNWRFAPVVAAVQALRGIDVVSAIGLVAEIGDLRRFAHPRKLMRYLGMVPAERSSSDRTARGSITETGNAHARRLLTEAAWNYRFKARIGYRAQQRQEKLSQDTRATKSVSERHAAAFALARRLTRTGPRAQSSSSRARELGQIAIRSICVC